MKLALPMSLVGRHSLQLTTVTNSGVKDLGQYFVLTRNRNGVVRLELDVAADLVDEGNSLCLGDLV